LIVEAIPERLIAAERSRSVACHFPNERTSRPTPHDTMASRRVRALEMAKTLEETENALRKIIVTTDTDLDTVFGIQYRQDIVHAGGLKAILKCMKEYHDVAMVQDLSCMALSNLAFENDKMRVVIAQLGGVSLILEAMTTHLEEEDVQFHAMQTLWRLTFNDWVRDAIVKKGSFRTIRKSMLAHSESQEYVQFWGDLLLKHLNMPPDNDSCSDDDFVLPDWLIDVTVAIVLLMFFRSLY
jgi:hypothetical protein